MQTTDLSISCQIVVAHAVAVIVILQCRMVDENEGYTQTHYTKIAVLEIF